MLLISPAFLASDYIANNELPVILKKAADNGVRIVPILISPSAFEYAKYKYPNPKTGPQEFTLASLQAANPLSDTLIEMTEGEQNRVLQKVANQLKDLLSENPQVGPSQPTTPSSAGPSIPANEMSNSRPQQEAEQAMPLRNGQGETGELPWFVRPWFVITIAVVVILLMFGAYWFGLFQPREFTVDPAKLDPRSQNVAMASGEQLKEYGRVLLSTDKEPGSAIYVFSAPKPGTYRMHVKYASAESRPVSIYINNTRHDSAALGSTTGPPPQGYYWRAQTESDQGDVSLLKQNTMELDSANSFPHISNFQFKFVK